MQFFVKVIIFILLIVPCIFAQQPTRPQKIEELRQLSTQIEQTEKQLDEMQERQQQIFEEIMEISEKDRSESEKIGARAVRLFPDRMLDQLFPMPDQDSFSVLSLTEIANFYFAPRLAYKNNSLVFVGENKETGRHGFFINLGGTLPETINEKTREFIALAKYAPPADAKDIKSEFSTDGLNFRNKVPVTVGSTYLIRALAGQDGDGIVALKIHRKDTDGSIIIFVKLIKILTAPAPKNAIFPEQNPKQEDLTVTPDYELEQKVQNALLQKGLTNVTVDTSTKPLTLRGTVPKGKLAEAVATAMEANGGIPVRIEIIEQK